MQISSDGRKDITIRERAARLALAVATVSRALNDDGSVKPNTKKRVYEMAKQLGYRVNAYARTLRSGRGNTIGCIVPQLDNYLISKVLSGIEKMICQDLQLHTAVTNVRIITPPLYLQPIPQGQIDAMDVSAALKTVYQNPAYQ